MKTNLIYEYYITVKNIKILKKTCICIFFFNLSVNLILLFKLIIRGVIMLKTSIKILSILFVLLISCDSDDPPIITKTQEARIYIDNAQSNSCPLDLNYPNLALQISYVNNDGDPVLEEYFYSTDIKHDGYYNGYVEAKNIPSLGNFGISGTIIGPCGTCCVGSQTGSILKKPCYRSFKTNINEKQSKNICLSIK